MRHHGSTDRGLFKKMLGGAVVAISVVLPVVGTPGPASADPDAYVGWKWYSNWSYSGWDAVSRETCNYPNWTAFNNERIVLRTVPSGDPLDHADNCSSFDVFGINSTGFNIFYAVEIYGEHTAHVWTEHGWGGQGAQVDVYAYSFQNNQRWRVEYPSDGSRIFHIASNQSLCMENPGASSTDGVRLKLNTCNSWNRQKFSSRDM